MVISTTNVKIKSMEEYRADAENAEAEIGTETATETAEITNSPEPAGAVSKSPDAKSNPSVVPLGYYSTKKSYAKSHSKR